MKIKIQVFFWGLFCFSVAVSAQTSIQFGGFQKIEKKFYGKEILLERDADLFVLDKEDKDIDLILFQFSKAPYFHLSLYNSTNFQLKNRVRILFPAKKKVKYEYALMKLLSVEGQLLLFVKARNSKTKQLKLLVQKLNDKGVQEGPFLEVDQADSEQKGVLFTQTSTGDFDVVQSGNGKLFASIRIDPLNEKSNKKIYAKVLNSNLKLSWSGSVELPFKEEYYQLKKYRLSNTGNVMLLGRRWLTIEKQGLTGKTKTKIVRPEENKPNYLYNFIVFNAATNLNNNLEVALKQKFISEIDFVEHECPDSITIAGFYSSEASDQLAGTFNMLYNALTDKVVYQKQEAFPSNFLNLFEPDFGLKSWLGGSADDQELENFKMDELIVRKDGSAMLTAEQYFVQVNTSNSRSVNGYSNVTTNYVYHYNHILAVYFNSTGEVKWNAKIPKQQVSYNDGGPYSSYVFNAANDGFSFVFNDNEDNLERLIEGEKAKGVGSYKRASVVEVFINNEGEMFRKELFSAPQEEIVFRPKSSWYQRDVYKSNRVYLYGLNYRIFKKTRFKLGVINFSH